MSEPERPGCDGLDYLRDQNDRLRKINAELLAAAKHADAVLSMLRIPKHNVEIAAILELRDVIAKAEGETP